MRTLLLFMLSALAASAQNFSDYSIVKVAGGYTFTEGPAWSPNGYMLYSDVPNNKIWKLVSGDKPDVFRDASNGANGNEFDAKGRLYTCESRTRRVTRTDRKGTIEVLAERWQGKRLNAPNDIIVRKDGHMYFTDPAFGQQADNRELDFYGVYHITPKGELELIAKPQGRPNGIALSPNGKILYVANSDERNIRAYDLDGQGKTSNERVLISGVDGPPDGYCRRREGKYLRNSEQASDLQRRRKAAAHDRILGNARQLRLRRSGPHDLVYYRPHLRLWCAPWGERSSAVLIRTAAATRRGRS